MHLFIAVDVTVDVKPVNSNIPTLQEKQPLRIKEEFIHCLGIYMKTQGK